jgi:hypothetical protein
MVSIIILILIFFCLVLHRYLTFFWESGILPYPWGFTSFATLFIVIYLINYIWLFGFLVGIILFVLTLFQIIYASYLWPFLLSTVKNIQQGLSIPRVNPIIYGIWSFAVLALGGLTILNFFISEYGYLLSKIGLFLDNDYKIAVILLVGSMVLGNLIRIYVLKRLSN